MPVSQKSLALARKTQDAWKAQIAEHGIEPGPFTMVDGLVVFLPEESPFMRSKESLEFFRREVPSLAEFAKTGEWDLYLVGIRIWSIYYLSYLKMRIFRQSDWKAAMLLRSRLGRSVELP